ncbi:tetratricopeptide repeat protein [Candidatus Chloroploca sp. Khr17]|uniref:ATP-binding protein n=1 Tax=Candidatus Chloroploca sp. Khr17 TaxID=2496869 RepID=UPI00101B94C6|nr:tetratricopeptide repeat protein [Candidatus Chloroploca sp. Khr17]
MPTGLSGTVTFLFTDIEGSTRLWEQYQEAMAGALARHDLLVRDAITSNGGTVFKTIGDAFCATFVRPEDALQAALAAQRSLAAEPWGVIGSLRVRMALHTGESVVRDGDYFGPTLNRVARLMATGHGGQILLSKVTSSALLPALPAEVVLLDLGERQLKDLSRPEHIFQVVVPDLPSSFPPLRTVDTRPNNLPAQTTTLIGREREVAAVCALLRQPELRLVSLTGPGGTGKTRLAIQVAAELLDFFAGGVFFVPLDSIRNPDDVLPAIMHSAGIKERNSQTSLVDLKEGLSASPTLIVLDNLEQVIAAVPLVGELLQAIPSLKLLVSSRTVLQVYGEHEYPVPPLKLPPLKPLPALPELTTYPSVALFVERTQAVKPTFVLTSANTRAVAEICHRLDGLPLAIELAAARSKLFTPQVLLDRLSNQFELLTTGGRDRPVRQQTLRAAIAWGYDLLPPLEQRLFQRLAVFAGGFTLEAAETICFDPELPDLFTGIESLLSKSLLRQDLDCEDTLRCDMLGTIRAYALEQLVAAGEAPMMQARHLSYYAAFVQDAEPELRSADNNHCLELFDREHDNLRAALSYCVEHHEKTRALQLGGVLWRYWWARGYLQEGRRWLETLIQVSADEAVEQRVQVISGAGVLANAQGDHERAAYLLEEALHIQRNLDDPASLAFVLTNLGIAVLQQGDYLRAIALFEESLALRRALGDPVSIASSLNNLGLLTLYQGEYERAERFFEETIMLRRSLGDIWGIGNSLNNLGLAAYYQGNYGEALNFCSESYGIATGLRDMQSQGLALTNLGRTLVALGRYQDAVSHLIQAVDLWHEIGNHELIAECLDGIADIFAQMGLSASAAELYGATAALRSALKAALPHSDQTRRDAATAALAANLGEQYEACVRQGAGLSLEAAIAYAHTVIAEHMSEDDA